jgi:multidrug resistance efflux pump
VVVHRWLDVGATVTEATAILRIADVNRLKLISRISARDVAEVRAGMTARLTAAGAPGKTFSGKVARVRRASDAPEETEIEIEVTSDGALRPGMAVEATIDQTKLKKAGLKPAAATTSGKDSELC